YYALPEYCGNDRAYEGRYLVQQSSAIITRGIGLVINWLYGRGRCCCGRIIYRRSNGRHGGRPKEHGERSHLGGYRLVQRKVDRHGHSGSYREWRRIGLVTIALGEDLVGIVRAVDIGELIDAAIPR